jgi:hypothetical protein
MYFGMQPRPKYHNFWMVKDDGEPAAYQVTQYPVTAG